MSGTRRGRLESALAERGLLLVKRNRTQSYLVVRPLDGEQIFKADTLAELEAWLQTLAK